jgi:hypothetical protein
MTDIVPVATEEDCVGQRADGASAADLNGSEGRTPCRRGPVSARGLFFESGIAQTASAAAQYAVPAVLWIGLLGTASAQEGRSWVMDGHGCPSLSCAPLPCATESRPLGCPR